MRYYTLATIDRRGGYAFQLKDPTGRFLIGTMRLNGEKVRHELKMTEQEFLKHSKNLALLCKIPGCAVYVVDVTEEAEPKVEVEIPACVVNVKKITKKKEPKIDVEILEPLDPTLPLNTPIFALRKIAKKEKVDTSGCSDAESIIRMITKARNKAVKA
jgi:hypothetical protein